MVMDVCGRDNGKYVQYIIDMINFPENQKYFSVFPG